MTLSHCWGKCAMECLLTSNITSMSEKIKINRLPATFRDAIVFTRELGARFIWIDSLCIIQDSLLDWQQESAVMGEI